MRLKNLSISMWIQISDLTDKNRKWKTNEWTGFNYVTIYNYRVVQSLVDSNQTQVWKILKIWKYCITYYDFKNPWTLTPNLCMCRTLDTIKWLPSSRWANTI